MLTIALAVGLRLREAIGLDPDVVGERNIASAVATRMAALALQSERAYQDALEDPREWDALIDEVVVPETWFFRDPAAFHLLADHALSGRRPYRVLSVPCGSGEEAYSIAMRLVDAGLGASDEGFWVDALDLSKRLLSRARRAIYPARSLRGSTLPDHHVHALTGGTFGLHARVRERVRFAQGNVATPSFLAHVEPYDAIFCRNLLIYLHADARERCLAHMGRLLSKSGILFAGAAEALSVYDRRFRPHGPGEAFAFTQMAAAPQLAPVTPLPALPMTRPARPRRSGQEAKVQAVSLARATSLADRGLYDEALDLCARHVAENGPTPEAFFLLGMLHQARGEKGTAETSYQQALLLHPWHLGALQHLELLAQARGDAARAAGYRRRGNEARRRA